MKEGGKEEAEGGRKEGRKEGRNGGRPELIPQMRTIKKDPGQLTGDVINPRPHRRSLFANWQPLLAFIIVHCWTITICPSFSGDLLFD